MLLKLPTTASMQRTSVRSPRISGKALPMRGSACTMRLKQFATLNIIWIRPIEMSLDSTKKCAYGHKPSCAIARILQRQL